MMMMMMMLLIVMTILIQADSYELWIGIHWPTRFVFPSIIFHVKWTHKIIMIIVYHHFQKMTWLQNSWSWYLTFQCQRPHITRVVRVLERCPISGIRATTGGGSFGNLGARNILIYFAQYPHPKTNSSPLNMGGGAPKWSRIVPSLPPIFRGKLFVAGRVSSIDYPHDVDSWRFAWKIFCGRMYITIIMENPRLCL